MRADHGKVIFSASWDEGMKLPGIDLEIRTAELHNSIGIHKRYHDPIPKSVTCILEKYQKLDTEAALQSAIKGISDIMGPKGLVPFCFVSGTPPTLLWRRLALPHN